MAERATRRRGAALEADLLRAAWEELAEVGYFRLTMEGVAARAHTGKQVLYRRWPNRAQLVAAAVRAATGSLLDEVPDTGSLREDVLAVLRRMADRQRDVGPDTLHGLVAEAPDLDGRFATVMRAVMTEILGRAQERGEVDLDGLSPRIVSLPADLTRHELLVTRDPIPDEALVEIVDEVFLPLLRTRSR